MQTPTAEVFVYRWDENTDPTVVTVDVQHPEVSGAEHLEMLQIRDQLARLEPTLTAEEKGALDAADRMLAEHAHLCHQERHPFIDLTAYRREQGIPPERWWYLDVVRYVPRRTVVTPPGA